MRGAATIVGWRWMLPRHVGALAAAILVFLLILSSGLEPVRAAQPDAAKRAYDHGLQLAKERQIDGAIVRSAPCRVGTSGLNGPSITATCTPAPSFPASRDS